MRASKRVLAALATGALFAPLNPFAPVALAAEPGATPVPPVQSIGEFCANVDEDDAFTDIGDNTEPHTDAINCAAFLEITRGGPQGKPANEYGPKLDVQRDQMASFIFRLIEAADELDTGDNIRALPAYDGSPDFTDVPPSNDHFDEVNVLSQAGVVEGGPNGKPRTQYDPSAKVTRAQMASFINRAVGYMLGTDRGFVNDNDYYVDDENARPHEPNINGITEPGISNGQAPASAQKYGPFTNILREQMASFLIRTLAELFDQDLIREAGAAEEAPSIEDARVATDAAMATDGGEATGTASTGDTIELMFDEQIATDSLMASDSDMASESGSSITVTDEDGTRAVIQCGEEPSADDDVTTAQCELDDDRTTLRLTLLENAVNVSDEDGADDTLSYPLSIEAISGFTGDNGEEVDLGSSEDTAINRDDQTVDSEDPDGPEDGGILGLPLP